MKVYFAGQGIPFKDTYNFRKDHFEDNYYFLYSYLEIKSRGPDYELVRKNIKNPREQIFLDSGAFTAFTKGKNIDIDHYIKVIKESNLKNYAGLDVIGDWEATRKNQEYMEAQGLNPIPTFHFNSPIKELERMIKKYEYIALGGLVPISMRRNLMKVWLDKCFNIIRDKVKVHGFGVNAFWAWKRYPFYSVDATSWVSGSKFRRIVKFENGRMKTIHKKSGKSLDLVRVWDGNYIDLNISNMIEYQKAADYITRLWAKRGISWK